MLPCAGRGVARGDGMFSPVTRVARGDRNAAARCLAVRTVFTNNMSEVCKENQQVIFFKKINLSERQLALNSTGLS